MSGSAETNHVAAQFEQRTVRPLGPIASGVVEYLVAHSGHVSIMNFPIRFMMRFVYQ